MAFDDLSCTLNEEFINKDVVSISLEQIMGFSAQAETTLTNFRCTPSHCVL